MDVTAAKQAEEALRRSESYLAEAQRLSHTGSWAGVPEQERSGTGPGIYRVLGFDPHKGLPRVETFFQAFARMIEPGPWNSSKEQAVKRRNSNSITESFIPAAMSGTSTP